MIILKDKAIGWPLSHPNATLAQHSSLARASSKNLNYATLAPQARPSGEILNYLLSSYFDILYMITDLERGLLMLDT